MLLSPNHKPSGFTLIELLVVISIISLLSSAILTGLSGARNQARLAANKRFETAVRSSISDCSVAFYNFESTSGSTVREAGGTGPDGAVSGTLERVDSLDGLGKAIRFVDGRNDEVKVPDKAVDRTKPLTVTGWAKIDGWPSQHGFFFADDNEQFQLGLENNITEYELEAETQNNSIRMSGPKADQSEWFHMAGVYDRKQSEIRMYIDGKMVNSVSASGDLKPGNLFLGGKGYLGGSQWDGLADNIRIYDCAF
ncbi:MAG: hypothetical protein BRC25_02355 [Parcubacteria group bacterium SW_6_46_9]|nr:MAG: hypothetical protein BRC25_02355 [Parcubacteria group bacterium SW_6_46_9]